MASTMHCLYTCKDYWLDYGSFNNSGWIDYTGTQCAGDVMHPVLQEKGLDLRPHAPLVVDLQVHILFLSIIAIALPRDMVLPSSEWDKASSL